jgi:hypothetical protein
LRKEKRLDFGFRAQPLNPNSHMLNYAEPWLQIAEETPNIITNFQLYVINQILMNS